MKNQSMPKPNIFVRLAVFLLTLAMVLTALMLVVFHDQLNLDALIRWFTYRSLSLSDTGQAESFRYNGAAGSLFVNLEGDLLVCTSNTVSLYSGSGVQYMEQPVNMAAPAADTGGNSAVLYDAGGTQLYVFRQRALAFTLESGGPLLGARLNANGLLTTVTQPSGFRSVVTVYDSSYQPRRALRLGAYVMDAQLSQDGRTLAVVTVSQESGNFTSTLSVYDLTAGDGEGDVSYDIAPAFSCSLGGNVILDLEQSAERIWALGDRGLSVFDQQGNQLGWSNWSDRYLKAYSLAGDGFAVALLGKYRAGSQAELLVVGSDGAAAGSLSLDEQVLSIDAAGRYFAVLTADRLDIYTRDMTLYSSLTDTQGARRALLRTDGTVMLIGAETARLYVPS